MPTQPTDNVYPNRINWINEPITTTPLSAGNLNKMDYALHELASRLVNLSILINTDMASQTDMLKTIKNVAYNPTNGIITFTYWDNQTFNIDLNIEKIPVSFSLSEDGILTMTTADGTKFSSDIKSVIPVYTFPASSTISNKKKTTSDGFEIKFDILPASIDQSHLTTELKDSFSRAEAAAENAEKSAKRVEGYSEYAESYCHGGTGIRGEERIDNAKYYSEKAKEYRDEAYSVTPEYWEDIYDFFKDLDILPDWETRQLFKFDS